MAKYALGNGRKTFKECENHNSYRYGISIESLWVYPLDSALIERGISLFVGGSFWSLKIAGDFDKNVEIHYKFWKIISDLLATQQNRAVSIIEIRVADTRRTIIRLVRVFVTSATPTPPHCWTESVVSVRQVSCQIWSTNFRNLERGDHPALSHSQPKDFLSIYPVRVALKVVNTTNRCESSFPMTAEFLSQRSTRAPLQRQTFLDRSPKIALCSVIISK